MKTKLKLNPIFKPHWYNVHLRTVQFICIVLLIVGLLPALLCGLIGGAIWGLGVAYRIVFDAIGRAMELE